MLIGDVKMSDMVKIENLKDMIVEIRGKVVLLDSDVAQLYGVETKRINEAVKNNTDKFPDGYIIELDKNEWDALKSKFSTSMKGGKVKLPSAFTEKGFTCLPRYLKVQWQPRQPFQSLKHSRKSVNYQEASKNSRHYKIKRI